MEEHIFNEQTGIGYTLQGDYYLPDLACSDEKEQHIGLWGQRHLRYLKQHRKVLYYNLLTSGKLNSYLAEIDKQAEEMFNRLVNQTAEREGVTEQLKADKEFDSKRSNTLFCSPNCRAKFYRQEAAESRSRECVCENCGKTFTTTRSNVKFCSGDCQYEHQCKKQNESGGIPPCSIAKGNGATPFTGLHRTLHKKLPYVVCPKQHALVL